MLFRNTSHKMAVGNLYSLYDRCAYARALYINYLIVAAARRDLTELCLVEYEMF